MFVRSLTKPLSMISKTKFVYKYIKFKGEVLLRNIYGEVIRFFSF